MQVQSNNTTGANSLDNLLSGHLKKTEEKEDVLGRDAFLTMLVAQLQHQDPLNPMEGTEFSSQLAQYSSLEQQMNTNDNLTSIVNLLQNQADPNLIDYIGKTVFTQDDSLQIDNGIIDGGAYTIKEPANVSVTIFDAEGLEVRRLYPGEQEAGSYNISWNGMDSSGTRLPDGKYFFEVQAIGGNGGYVPVTHLLEGEVTGVTYENQKPFLMIGDQRVDPSKLVEVWAEEPQKAGDAPASQEQPSGETPDEESGATAAETAL